MGVAQEILIIPENQNLAIFKNCESININPVKADQLEFSFSQNILDGWIFPRDIVFDSQKLVHHPKVKDFLKSHKIKSLPSVSLQFVEASEEIDMSDIQTPSVLN